MWPIQSDPPQSDWSIWRQYLWHFEEKGKLSQPLGKWVAHPHQIWQHFIDTTTGRVYDSSQDTLYCYPPLSTPRVLRSGYWYDQSHGQPCLSISEDAHPVSIIHNPILHGSWFQVRASPNPFPPTPPPHTCLKDRQYYHSLLPPNANIPYNMFLQEEILYISINTSVNKGGTNSSSSWEFSSSTVLYSGGHTHEGRCTNYRVALRGILTAICILYNTEQRNLPETIPTIILQCSHKKALKEAFRDTPVGVTTATQTNQDLILDIHHLRNLLSTKIQPCCSQGSEISSTHPILSNPLNIDFIQDPSLQNHSMAVDTTPLSHVITLLHDSTPFTGDIKMKIHELEYQRQLQAKVQKDNCWTDNQFHAVNWTAYYQAYRRVPRYHRISLMKLSHKLWNTNSQNERFCDQTSTCPICSQATETVDHVYKCQHSAAVAHRTAALKSFSTSLQSGTPKVLLEVLLEGILQWSQTGNATAIKAPTDGSRLPSLRVITDAFNSQTELGWGSFQ